MFDLSIRLLMNMILIVNYTFPEFINLIEHDCALIFLGCHSWDCPISDEKDAIDIL